MTIEIKKFYDDALQEIRAIIIVHNPEIDSDGIFSEATLTAVENAENELTAEGFIFWDADDFTGDVTYYKPYEPERRTEAEYTAAMRAGLTAMYENLQKQKNGELQDEWADDEIKLLDSDLFLDGVDDSDIDAVIK